MKRLCSNLRLSCCLIISLLIPTLTFSCDETTAVLSNINDIGGGQFEYTFDICLEFYGLEGSPTVFGVEFAGVTIDAFSPASIFSLDGDEYVGAISGSSVLWTTTSNPPTNDFEAALCFSVTITISGTPSSIIVHTNFTEPPSSTECHIVIPLPCNNPSAGGLNVDFDGTGQGTATSYDIPDGTTIGIDTDGTAVFPNPGDASFPAGIALALFTCDPSAQPVLCDLDDPATFGSTSICPCFAGLSLYPTGDLNDGGESNSVPGNSTLWVVPITLDYVDCTPSPCLLDPDFNGDGCFDSGDLVQLNYLPPDSPCDCNNPGCGAEFECEGAAISDFNLPPILSDGYFDLVPDLPASGNTYEFCYEYTTGATQTEVGISNLMGVNGPGCFTRTYLVYDANCNPISPTILGPAPAPFASGNIYSVTPNTTYIFCVEIATNTNCTFLEDGSTWVWNPEGGGCGTCPSPCTGAGMGSVPTYDDRSYLSCWVPDCAIYGPTSVTNCFEATADGTGFLGFANITSHDGIPSCITRTWELTESGNCGTVIPNPIPNANGVGSGFNPEYSGLTPNGTYVLCVTYTLLDFTCGFDGISDGVCIDSYGSGCSAILEGTSMNGYACKDDNRDLTTVTNWVETQFGGAVQVGFVVFCNQPTLPLTEAFYNANAFDAILEDFDVIGDFIDNSGVYVDPFNASQTCAGPLYIVPITISAINAGNFVLDWNCFDTDDVIEVELGAPPTANATASPMTICPGQSSTLTATGGGTYEWSDGLGTNPVVNVSPTMTTTYTVTVTDDSGYCESTADVTVTVNTIMASFTNVMCDDNGTSSDPSDDTYTFDVTVTGGEPASSWNADDPNNTSGNYGAVTSFGPYDISDGNITITITDVNNSFCETMITVMPPAPCSDACTIMAVESNIVCNDNGTPTDPSDDTFTFDVTVTGSNTGASWTANDPNNTTGSYGVVTSFGPYNISDGNLSFAITDIDDSGCTTTLNITAPPTCSDACTIMAAEANIICDDNGSPSDPSDDTFTFEVTVTGTNTGVSWTANDPNNTTGSYGVVTVFGPYNISDGNLSFTITDVDDTNCTTTVNITAPMSCSNECLIMANVGSPVCNNNGTPSDPDDDTYTFSVTVTGTNTGAGWSANDPNGETGSYGMAVVFGPFNIADGPLNITITDDSDGTCTTMIMVTPPSTCSGTCSISGAVSNIMCNDGGTPSDPSDDTFSFDVVVTGSNIGASWTANDPNSTTGLYGVSVNFGPYDISDGDLSFLITDIDDPTCTTMIDVMAPMPCSDDCDIMASVANIVCDNNGTATDPSDDVFFFDVTVTGSNTGTGWNANDVNGTTGSYGVVTTFGPYNISDGNLNFTITDNNDNTCTTPIMVTAPSTCSDDCDIMANVANVMCDDGGTPSDPSDDTFSFEVTVTGVNTGASWTANDPNNTTGTYGGATVFGTYNISDGDLSFTITDVDDPSCTATVNVTAPSTCSDDCDIMSNVANILCDDNGTPSDPSDDTYTFDVMVTGSNTGASWTSNDPNATTGNYGVTTSFGPYNISGGNLSFTITDVDDPSCTTTVNVTAPSTCSDACDIMANFSSVVCNDNGTPSDPDDDTYTFNVTVTGNNTGAGWSANDPNGESGTYGVAQTFGPFNIADGMINITITDDNDGTCTTMVMVPPPNTCSGTCSIANNVTNILCDDNGTPSDPSDDTFSFDVVVTGSNIGASWSSNDPNATTGLYGVSVSFGPYNIADGDLNFTITDIDDPTCTTDVMVSAPATCSDECDIMSAFANVLCDDNGTPTDPSDDTYSFEVTVTGSNTGSSWSANDPNATTGSYNTAVVFGPYNITDGDQNFTITDAVDSGCSTNVMVMAPATCSNTCMINNTVTNILCDDNGTPSDPSDDIFSFDVEVNGSNTASGWSSNDPNATTGNYGVVVNFGPYNISDGNLSFTITDNTDAACTTTVMVTAPQTCSDACDITSEVSNIICDDNGTPSDPSDDVYFFDVTVMGSNTSTGWSANDPNATTGNYGAAVTFGPYDIDGGNLNFTITDNGSSTCTTSVMVTAPSTCSNDCTMNVSFTNVVCNDAGTPSDPLDDTFTVDITVTGTNTGATWSADDPNSMTGSYGVVTSFGPFLIVNGSPMITFVDVDDPTCTAMVSIQAPSSCSGTCSISNVVSNIECNDAGTPSDPTDDTFSFDVMVNGSNTGASWTSNDPNSTSGNYSVITNFGPFAISGGTLNFVISDVDDASCTTIVSVTPPSTCSDQCDIMNVVSNIICDDNGTPTDPSDDTYTFEVTVTGTNTGSSWSANDPNSTSGSYNTLIVFGPYLIGGGDLNFDIVDGLDGTCITNVDVQAPMTCSGQCTIDNQVSNVLCDDNGTPTDPSDDTYTFDVTVTGTNTSTSWNANDGNGTSGAYNVAVSFGPFAISGGDQNFTISDNNDPGCITQVIVVAPSTCSDACTINAVVSNVLCDDAGTPSDPNDDVYFFDVIVSGENVSGGWTANDPNGVSGQYDNTTTFGPYLINGGDLNFVVADANDITCTTQVNVMTPMSCSDECQISANFTNVICDDAGTPSDPLDDTFTFEVTVTGVNNGLAWTANDANATTGFYDVPTVFGPYLIVNGNPNFQIIDDLDATCSTNLTVLAPNACSGTCSIGNAIANILCDDAGTPSDASDDTFTFEVTVNGSNTAAGWTANDPNATVGAYGVSVLFGPYPIAAGDFNFSIVDDAEPSCITNASITAPMTCSDECEVSAMVSNIVCNDGGTSSDASDDFFTFDVVVSGSNTGSTWGATDPNSTSGSYNAVISFGPYLITDGDLNFDIVDGNDGTCVTNVLVAAPSACSNTCLINSTVINVLCDDAGTPADPSDDTFSFDIDVSGTNTSASWSANDPNATMGTYGSIINMGPYLISNGNLNFDIVDDNDLTCMTSVNVVAPNTCSPPCTLIANVNNVQCDDNGTPSDPTDDTFTFVLDINSMNGGSGWTANDPTNASGVYGNGILFGPYPVSGGNLMFTITDNNFNDCTVDVNVTAPGACSGTCSISNTVTNILCDDAGTPTDPSDDTFSFEVTVTGSGTGLTWIANDGINLMGNYNLITLFGPYLISDGNISFSISDVDEPSCTTQVDVIAPSACSGTCSISNTVSNIMCDDAGTPTDPTDDTFTFDVTVNGVNTGASWSADDMNATSGMYNTSMSFGPFLIVNGNVMFAITDDDDSSCSTIVDAEAPSACSSTCALMVTGIGTDVMCFGDTNGSIDLEVTGASGNLQFMWNPSTVTGEDPNGLAAGNYTVTVTDDANCTDEVTVVINEPTDLVLNCSELNEVSVPGGNDGVGQISVSGGTEPYEINWDGPGSNDGSQMGVATGDVSISNLEAGAYSVTVVDDNGCITTCSFIIGELGCDLEVMGAISNVNCFNGTDGSIELMTTGGVGALTYTWSDVSITGPNANDLSAGSYSVTVEDESGCTAEGMFNVASASELVLNIETPTQSIVLGDSVLISANVNLTQGDILSVEWDNDPSISCPTCLETYVSPTQTTLYTVIITDINNCIVTANILIEVDTTVDIYIGNVFSPNGDGRNDYFYPQTNGTSIEIINSMLIFDRWGNKLFSKENFLPDNSQEGWDGTFKGKELNPAVFVYLIHYTTPGGIQGTLKGDVTIVK